MSETPTHPEVEQTNAARELIAQTSYSGITVDPTLDQDFDPPFHGLEVTTDGNVQIETPNGVATLPAVTGRIYPVEIVQVLSNQTAINSSEIILYAK